jgi:hypothetical protein
VRCFDHHLEEVVRVPRTLEDADGPLVFKRDREFVEGAYPGR